jgi:hypothetical protein
MRNTLQLSDFARRKLVAIPAWAKAIRLVSNAIDGYPYLTDGVYDVDAFIANATELQRKGGQGEWNVLVYAITDPEGCVEWHPYGREHPYRQLRSKRGHHVKLLAELSYMMWNAYTFVRFKKAFTSGDTLRKPSTSR